jgi:hypothetical protein
VQRRCRPAQHLDPLELGEVEVGELALAIGERLRDAVNQHLDAAHPEVGARPEASDHQSLVERRVPPVGRLHPGHEGQRLVEPGRQPLPGHRGAVEDRHGAPERRQPAPGRPRDPDGEVGQSVGALGRHEGGAGEEGQEQAGSHPRNVPGGGSGRNSEGASRTTIRLFLRDGVAP